MAQSTTAKGAAWKPGNDFVRPQRVGHVRGQGLIPNAYDEGSIRLWTKGSSNGGKETEKKKKKKHKKKGRKQKMT
jgi:hypothetical protein